MNKFFEELDERLSQDFRVALEADNKDDYLANVAMAALEVLDQTSTVFENVQKSKGESDKYRDLGNKAYKTGDHQQALLLYNRALANAPNESYSLKLAYSNRSTVLLAAYMFTACEKDCSTALGIDCGISIPKHVDKLRKRKLVALAAMMNVDLYTRLSQKIMKDAESYYKLESQNPDIPCASSDIDVIIESGIPKVVAKRDIAPGTMVALEKAFVSWAPSKSDLYFSCYYCHKLDLNLFPCKGCVVALFCSKQCEEICMTEYHSVECQIIGKVQLEHDQLWLLKVMLKIRSMFDSWEDLIAMSNEFALDQMKEATVNEIFDGKNLASLLSFSKDRHFVHDAVCNISYLCAVFLKHLKSLPSFLPQDALGQASALKALARITMHIGLFNRITSLILITDDKDSDNIGTYSKGHKGLFPFIGKLKHCCVPNLQKVTLNNSVALIAMKNITAGTELTVTHAFHWLENALPNNKRKEHILTECHVVCPCFLCNATPEEWEEKMSTNLSESLKQSARECLHIELQIAVGIPVKQCLDQLYNVISNLGHVPFSVEYALVYTQINVVHAYVLNKLLGNVVLGLDM